MDHMNFQIPGGMPRPMNHPPPQVFGSYGPDGLPQVQHLPPEVAAQMFPDSHLLFDESQDAKRRRIARVRRAKIHTMGWSGASRELLRRGLTG